MLLTIVRSLFYALYRKSLKKWCSLSCSSDELNGIRNIGFPVKQYTGFSKAFHSIDHSILPKKLTSFGFNSLVTWFQSYLSIRWQFVSIEGGKSKRIYPTSGVPRVRSKLGLGVKEHMYKTTREALPNARLHLSLW